MEEIISLIIPIYNEEENIQKLNSSIKEALNNINYEVIYVDDGSKDKSFEKLKELSNDEKVKIIKFSRNFGQTAALQAGIDLAKGDVIVPLDADLQNDPKDIPAMLEIYRQGFDIVSGWRKKRYDNIIRVIPSKIANFIISNLTNVKIHDFGCTLKIYNAKLLKKVNLYGELHRFIPALVSMYGNKITEVQVTHHPRVFGQSKYNLSRTKRVLMDLFTIWFLIRYKDRPMYFFGTSAFWTFILSILCLIAGLYISSNFFILSCAMFLLTFINLGFGLIAEMLMRTQYESQNKRVYNIESVIE